MIFNLLVAWLASGFVGAILWLWAEWEMRNIGYAPMWWQVLYPTLLGPIGLLMGGALAISRFRYAR